MKNKKTILITRPQPMGQNLVDLLKTYLFETILFPTIEIKNKAPSFCEMYFKSLEKYQAIIFTSINAVNSVASTLQIFCQNQNVFPELYGVGKTTAQALKSIGFSKVFYPEADFNSENLLKELKIIQRQTHYLIVTGEDGRAFLAEELEKRGAMVSLFCCYQRVCPYNSEKDIWIQWKQKNLDTVVITSQTALDHLLKMLNKEGQAFIKECNVLTFGPRIASYAQSLGFKAHVDWVLQASNESILNFLVKKFKNMP